MKINKKTFLTAMIVILLLFLFIKSTSIIGVSASRLEKDARHSQRIDDAWTVSESVSKEIGAMLFYNSTEDQYIHSIYLKHSGLSFGYFFASGGSLSGIEDGVIGLSYSTKGLVLISMNKHKINKIQFDNNVEVTTSYIDPTKPFVKVISGNDGEVMLYNVDGNKVAISNIQCY